MPISELFDLGYATAFWLSKPRGKKTKEKEVIPQESPVYLPKTEAELQKYVNLRMRRTEIYPELPASISGMKKILLEADHERRILWGRDKIVHRIQARIDAAPERKSNLFLLIGVHHAAIKQIEFVNSLLDPNQTPSLKGITHLAHEYLQRSDLVFPINKTSLTREIVTRMDMQPVIDTYTKTGNEEILIFLKDYFRIYAEKHSHPKHHSFDSLLNEIIKTFRLSRNRYSTVAVDAPKYYLFQTQNPKSNVIWKFREAFMINNIYAKLEDHDNVIFSINGRGHITKSGLGRFIKIKDEILSIHVRGGGFCNVAFDHALKELGRKDKKWLETTFAVEFRNISEADMVIHLPFEDKSFPSSSTDNLGALLGKCFF